MRRALLAVLLLVLCRCAAPPAPTEPPAAAPPPPAVAEEQVIGTVQVTASSLNVRSEASTNAAVVTQVKRGTKLAVLAADDSWTRVRLDDGTRGWVASRFVARPGAKTASPSRRKGSCPPDSDFAFVETPTLAFSDSGAHGLVVVEATVNTKGNVTGTKVVSNSTGDESLAFLAAREIKGAKFSPPIRNCVLRDFIFTYRRTF